MAGGAKWCRSGSKLARGENESDEGNEENSKMYECVWRKGLETKVEITNVVKIDGALRLGTRPVTVM